MVILESCWSQKGREEKGEGCELFVAESCVVSGGTNSSKVHSVVVPSSRWTTYGCGVSGDSWCSGVAADEMIDEIGDKGILAIVPLIVVSLQINQTQVPSGKGSDMGSVLCRRSPHVRAPSGQMTCGQCIDGNRLSSRVKACGQ